MRYLCLFDRNATQRSIQRHISKSVVSSQTFLQPEFEMLAEARVPLEMHLFLT